MYDLVYANEYRLTCRARTKDKESEKVQIGEREKPTTATEAATKNIK